MDMDTYKLIHLLGLALALATSGGLTLSAQVEGNPKRGLLTGLHGVAMVLLLVAGFGMVARGGFGMPGWVLGKVVIWLLLGAYPVLVRKVSGVAAVGWYVLALLTTAAAYLAIHHPGS